MILAVDVWYDGSVAYSAGVLFNDWADTCAVDEVTFNCDDVPEYVPGEFYKRELPVLLGLIDRLQSFPSLIIIDGYVYLEGQQDPGLGKHLYNKLGSTVPVIGVAKSPFKGISDEYAVYRGRSSKPLYITAVGIDINTAKQGVLEMHGSYRLPTLLKRVDQLSRAKSIKV